MAVALSLFLFSLLGVPPLVGFAAKFQIFRVLFDAGQIYASKSLFLSNTMYALLIIGGINTVISLVYYVRVIKIMVIDSPEPESAGPIALSFPVGSVVYASVLAVAVFVHGHPLGSARGECRPRDATISQRRRNLPGLAPASCQERSRQRSKRQVIEDRL